MNTQEPAAAKTLAVFQFHPVAEMFPMIDEKSQEWIELRESIKRNGLLDPIIVDGHVLVDGRNRLKLCTECGIPPRFVEWSSLSVTGISQADFIESKNINRRHLTDDQRTQVVTKIARWEMEREAEEAKRATQLKPGENRVALKSGPPEKDSKAKHARSTAGKIAAKAKVSRHKAEQAIKLSKAADSNPEAAAIQEKVINGEMSLVKASSFQRDVERVGAIKKKAPELFEKLRSGEVTTIDEAERQIDRITNPAADSEVVWSLKFHWKKTTPDDQRVFLDWVKSAYEPQKKQKAIPV